jgi:hypothetical protein
VGPAAYRGATVGALFRLAPKAPVGAPAKLRNHLLLCRFKTEGEAIKMANEAPTLPSPSRGGGLGRGRICRVAEAVEYGSIVINEGIIPY